MLNVSNIQIIVAHPDDEILSMGGAIARWVNQGRKVNVLVVTDGGFPGTDPVYIATRREQSASAAARIGYSVDFLGIRDMQLNRYSDPELLDIIRPYCSGRDAVLTHWSDDINPDHKKLSEIVTLAHRYGSVKLYGQFETPSSSCLSMAFTGDKNYKPNCYIDIADTLEIKLEAWDMFRTEQQEYPLPRNREGIKVWARFRGMPIKSPAAEAVKIIYLSM